MEFTIEDNVPVPPAIKSTSRAIRSIQVGQSILVKNYSKHRMQSLCGHVKFLFKLDAKFLCVQEGADVRAWRIK